MYVHTVGLHTVGLHTVGLHTVGLHTVGLHTVGLHTVGLHAVGLHTVDERTVEKQNYTICFVQIERSHIWEHFLSVQSENIWFVDEHFYGDQRIVR